MDGEEEEEKGTETRKTLTPPNKQHDFTAACQTQTEPHFNIYEFSVMKKKIYTYICRL